MIRKTEGRDPIRKRVVHMGEEDGDGRLWPKCGAYRARFITTPYIPILADCPDCLREVKIELNAKYGKLEGTNAE